MDEVAQRLDGKVLSAVLAMVKALVVMQAGGFGGVTKAVEGLGGFARESERTEKVFAHYGKHLWGGAVVRADRAVMFDCAEELECTAKSEDRRMLRVLVHVQRHQQAVAWSSTPTSSALLPHPLRPPIP
ncbi:hypothetical protein OG948_34170 (plasmid) [Embleya sp. NBC_00888]|uniref:hypothetical protein n=1 Tax=Embleya sp. NBC_00888 TaxID=2975960 RepID=UPI002F90E4BC|nr:hypothetical protein OG948_34170 [Embleya sp. NBC_00888]